MASDSVDPPVPLIVARFRPGSLLPRGIILPFPELKKTKSEKLREALKLLRAKHPKALVGETKLTAASILQGGGWFGLRAGEELVLDASHAFFTIIRFDEEASLMSSGNIVTYDLLAARCLPERPQIQEIFDNWLQQLGGASNPDAVHEFNPAVDLVFRAINNAIINKRPVVLKRADWSLLQYSLALGIAKLKGLKVSESTKP